MLLESNLRPEYRRLLVEYIAAKAVDDETLSVDRAFKFLRNVHAEVVSTKPVA